MENNFSKYLLENGWEKINPMSFQRIKNPQYELFFDTSNQVELYFNNERKDEKYLLSELELIEFLRVNGVSS